MGRAVPGRGPQPRRRPAVRGRQPLLQPLRVHPQLLRPAHHRRLEDAGGRGAGVHRLPQGGPARRAAVLPFPGRLLQRPGAAHARRARHDRGAVGRGERGRVRHGRRRGRQAGPGRGEAGLGGHHALHPQRRPDHRDRRPHRRTGTAQARLPVRQGLRADRRERRPPLSRLRVFCGR
ncbi:hypothetical protein SGPA1_10862 [Streptomyces misionensis JCM 4497]